MYELGENRFALHAASGVSELLDAAGIDAGIARLRHLREERTGAAPPAADDRGDGCAGGVPCFDLRRYPPPEPMQRALAILDGLDPASPAILWTPLRPVPLLEQLDARGYRFDCAVLPDGSARITLHPRTGAAPSGD